ncbi:hypothetical protein [Parapedobacter indicus]|uniref:Uncharacterized protein n=1 Tax=Parapedobacter indicus TaxID=1477437 RepID=A0A1I3T7A2_9SPHI|nr:hypothetical protein [Parapedobacter indicus]PPK99599.1 hypothetical protein CLV26_112118 [Parapedobacter indicus]SFJ66954.1 hypothetical protein SAMN05444682_11263 [Parapedobacter indicus]
MRQFVTIGMLMLLSLVASAQHKSADIVGQDSSAIVVDNIQFKAEQFVIDPATRTATVTLALTSLKDKPRELKINVYGTQLVDNARDAYYFSTIALGRVLMRFEDKQNYLHYLLQPQVPAKLTITADAISTTAAAIQVVKIVFEDSAEEGRFLDAYLTDPSSTSED